MLQPERLSAAKMGHYACALLHEAVDETLGMIVSQEDMGIDLTSSKRLFPNLTHGIEFRREWQRDIQSHARADGAKPQHDVLCRLDHHSLEGWLHCFTGAAWMYKVSWHSSDWVLGESDCTELPCYLH